MGPFLNLDRHLSSIQIFHGFQFGRMEQIFLVGIYLYIVFITFQVRYKLAPLIWKRLYKDRARFTGGANAITLLLGGRGDSMWPSSLTLIIVTAIVACVHTVMLSKYLISAPIPRSQASNR